MTADRDVVVRTMTAHGTRWVSQDDLLEWLNAERAVAVDHGLDNSFALVAFLNRLIDKVRKLV